MAYGGSIDHVTDDVNDLEGHFVTQIYLHANISKTVEDRDSVPMYTPIENGIWRRQSYFRNEKGKRKLCKDPILVRV